MVNIYQISAGTLLFVAVLFLPQLAYYAPLPFTSGVMATESMTPAIKVHDLMYVDRTVDFSDVVVGDVVMFRGSSVYPISHRVIAPDDFTITTKGDANLYDDTPITKDSYLGVVISVIPTHVFGPVGFVMGAMLSISSLLFCGVFTIIIFRIYRRKQSHVS